MKLFFQPEENELLSMFQAPPSASKDIKENNPSESDAPEKSVNEEEKENINASQEQDVIKSEISQESQLDSGKWNDEETINDILEELNTIQEEENATEYSPETNTNKRFRHKNIIFIAGALLIVIAAVAVFPIKSYLEKNSQSVSITTSVAAKKVTSSQESTEKLIKKTTQKKQVTTQKTKKSQQTKSRSSSVTNSHSKKTNSTYQTAEKSDFENSTKSTTQSTTVARCTNNNNHSAACGKCGMWFNSYEECKSYISSRANELSSRYYYETGEIKSPVMRYWSCSYCGKWTGSIMNY